tara:strand:- start:40 stop:726 length:687 start_codon:yes stop_codon:yes gene_type:complete
MNIELLIIICYFSDMNKIINLPDTLPVFPLSNFIFFPDTSAPLNVFEPRYIQMIDESIKTNRMIGMAQPKGLVNPKKPDLFKVGCLGKISNFNETDDGRYVIVLNGITRFNIVEEINSGKLFREFKIDYTGFECDINNKEVEINFSDINLIFNNLKKIFEKQGYIINWNELEKQSLDQTINTLSMAAPFSKEEKQMLLEAKNIKLRKQKLEQIIKLYNSDNFSNKTLQ